MTPLDDLPTDALEAMHLGVVHRLGVLVLSFADDHQPIDQPCVRAALAEAHYIEDELHKRADRVAS